jgi:Protein of unknown function (DUF4446)
LQRRSREARGDRHLLDSGGRRALVPRRLPEDRPIDLNALVAPYLGLIVVGLATFMLLLILIMAGQVRRMRRLARRLDGMTRGGEGRSLEAILDAHLDKVYAVARELDELSARSAVLEANGRRALQRAALVRFNPFEETGGNQSFALALTDANGDGFVVSSLHARAGTRLYAKTVTAGRSEAALSAEEAEALRLALAATPTGARATAADQARASV